jgi:NADH dehydrogenase
LIAVLGSTGFVGSRVAVRLAAEGLPHRLLARRTAGPAKVHADLTQPETLAPALEGCQVVVHCAAVTADRKERQRGEYEQVNAVGTRHLVQAARQVGVERIVLLNGLGTRKGRPGSYMRTRWDMLEAVRGSGLGWVSPQPSILFGSGAAFPTAIAGLARSAPLLPVLGAGLCVQPFWVEDLVTCLVACATESRWDGRAFDLGGPERMTMREFCRLIAAAAGRPRPLVPVPLPLARVQARLMAVLPRPPLTRAALELFDFDNCTDEGVVEREFGFRPRSLRDHFAGNGLD